MATDDRRYALGPDEGLGGTRKFFAQPLRMLATGAETTLEYTLFEQRLERGYAPPLHVHHIEDEAFYLVDGAIEVACGDVRWQLAPGGFAFLPHSVPHAFRVVSDTARLLQLTAPSGFEDFAADVADVPLDEATSAAVTDAAHRAGYEILGPPPFDT
ncbi:MAG: cupin domain-containing protein [Streptomycetaceae bacterium]|jgi:mannose-6-phosphate isomerase-like protein (cupin superfamily)|nr:cupin domain-containing protein [Streptomycetaceae bacterium]